MKNVVMIALLCATFATGCTFLRKMYNISPPAMTPEERSELIAESKRDTTAVILPDSVYYAGKPAFRASEFVRSEGKQVDLNADGYATAVVYAKDDDGARDTYVIALLAPTKHLSIISPDGIPPILTKLLRLGVLTPGQHQFNATKLQQAMREGIFRERIDLDSEDARLNRFVNSLPPSDPHTFSSPSTTRSGGSTPSSTSKTPGGIPRSQSVWNQCTQTLHVFVGDKPPYSGGNSMTVSGNSHNASLSGLHSGVKFWIVDGNDNPITGITVGENTKEIVIGSDCHTLTQH